MTDASETTITAVDGTDALAFVIIRPSETEGGVSIEAAANGLSKQAAAYVLRHVADQWDAEGSPAELLADLERARSIAVALEQENAHQAERLTAIHTIADGLEDHLVGDAWHLANRIKQLADDTITVAEALAEDGAK